MKFKNLLLATTLLVSLNATDFDDEPVKTWNDDGYESLSTVNNILKIMSFTKASEFVNKGNYRIQFKDPFKGAGVVTDAVLNVTQASASAPMIIKFVDRNDESGIRYAYIKVNKSASSKYPLGDFVLTTYALDNNYTIDTWDNSPSRDRLKLIVSASSNGATIKMDNTYKNQSMTTVWNGWINLVIEDANFTSGYGRMVGDNNITLAFDNNYILDKNSSGGGVLSSRSEHNYEYYKYKLFDENGSRINLGANVISSFSFKTPNGEWGFLGANYKNGDYPQYSGIFYGVALQKGDVVTNMDDNQQYDVDEINNTVINGEDINFTKISQNGVQKYVAPWEEAKINTNTYYKSGDVLYPPMTCNNDECIPDYNLSNGNIYSVKINGNDYTYKVKAVIVVKTKKILDQDNNITNLTTQGRAPTDINRTEVANLKEKIDNNTLTNPNIDYSDTSEIKSVESWFNSIKDSYNTIPVKVVNGEIQ